MDNLCTVCRDAFSGINRQFNCEAYLGWARRKFYSHHRCISALEAAAEAGCQLCTFLWAGFTTEDKAELGMNSEGLQPLEKELPFISYSLDTRMTQRDVDCHFRFTDSSGKEIFKSFRLCQHKLSRTRYNPPDLTTPKPCSSTGSEQSLQLAAKWISECVQNHPKCEMSGMKSFITTESFISMLPARLVHVGSSGGQPVRLCDTKSLPRGTLYMTLSHCWGQFKFLSLVTENIDVFKKEIPFHELPKTFQDAVTFTRSTLVKYIWIDSLCIVQDSQRDWRRESLQMAHIYSNGFCNLSATSSPDGRQGLFFERNLSGYESVAIDVHSSPPKSPGDSKIPGRVKSLAIVVQRKVKKTKPVRFVLESNFAPLGLYIIRDTSLWPREVEESVLCQRGWVFQERLLARRALHFTSRQIWFECQEFRACELSPKAGWQEISDSRKADLNRNVEMAGSHNDTEFVKLRALKSWKDMVSEYTVCALTRESDRLIAIAGLARLMKLKIRCRYVAGLWDNDTLAEQLLWERYDGEMVHTDTYQAPTWSWASVKGKVSWVEAGLMISDSDSKPRVSILGVDTGTTDGNEMSQVISGCLRLKGTLLEAVIEPGETQLGAISGKRIRIQGFIKSYLIQDDNEEEPEGPLYCTIFFNTWKGSAIGLVLKPVRNHGQFQRVGTFRWGSFDYVLRKTSSPDGCGADEKMLGRGLFESYAEETGQYTFSII